MDFFYDGQIRRYVTQFMRVFIGFKYKDGSGQENQVPVLYGDMTRQVAAIIKDNSENKLPTVPKISCYISGIEIDTNRLTDSTFVSKVSIRERRYTDDAGTVDYQQVQGGGYTVERLMPTPYTLTMKADIWTSNTDQKLQLFEQIMVLFNPSLEIQTTDNYIDWTSISVIDIQNITFSSRTIPVGTESDIDICNIEFKIPIWLSPPAKVKKLGIVQSIISNVFTDSGDIVDLEGLIYNGRTGSFGTTTNRYRILLFKSNNGQPYDYDVTISDPTQAILSLGLDQKEYRNGETLLWPSILEVQGGYTPGSQIYFKQASGYDMVGTFIINPLDEKTIIVTFDQDTIPANTIINSTISGVTARGTVDAIIDPYKYNPITTFNGKANIPLGIRFLMLDDVNPNDANGDGPDAWKSTTNNDPVILANSIIEWNGTDWVEVWNPLAGTAPTYIQNLRTGVKYRWDGEQWLKAFEGEYAPNFWGFME